LNSEKYIDILENVLLPTAWARFGLGPIPVVQDLSPIHTSHAVGDWFADHPEFELLPWPPKGADLNPIENLWSEMVRDMDTQHVASPDRLWEDVSLIWDNLKTRNDYWRILASSMPSRLKLVREMLGDWTKY
jgi:transposase